VATARDWLRQNGYEDIAELIDEVVSELQERGSKERRNWWDVLSGRQDGKPNKVAGREFPVLAVAQTRQGKLVTENAIKRSDDEKPPPARKTGRWPRKRRRKASKRP
jgi:hypothetical protein